MKNYLLGFAACLAPAIALAWVGPGVIRAVTSHDGAYVIDSTLTHNGCGTAGKFWWPREGDADAKDMYAMAMAAYLAGKRISVVPAANQTCFFGATLITHMSMGD